jgi:hypothetical protein
VNEFLGSAFSERVVRLALGLEPTDPVRAARVGTVLDVAVDGIPFPLARTRRDPAVPWWKGQDVLTRIGRRRSCRHVLLFRDGVEPTVDVRLVDDSRRYVPRRLSIPLPNPPPPGRPGRVCRPALFPGAAYDVPAGAVGVRGTVRRGGPTGPPLRWARVEARRTSDSALAGRAHGDDRGEFLLLLGAAAVRGVELSLPVEVTVTVFGPTTPLDPATVPGSDVDPLWDLPLEVVDPAPAGQALEFLADPVLDGEEHPPGYVSGASRALQLELDGLESVDFEFN